MLRSSIAAVCLIITSTLGTTACGANGIQSYGYRVVATYEHDPRAYCQGLLFADGMLFESTGRLGTSSIRRVALATGKVVQKRDLPPNLFGEGLALLGDEFFQLTWTAHEVNVFDRETFAVLRSHEYIGEGWGLTTDGTNLIMSNGTDVLSVRDPKTFEETGTIPVTVDGRRLKKLNELEYVEGEIWANIWQSDFIARIDPDSGHVLGWINLTGIFDYSTIDDNDAVLNGIAYDADDKRIFVTGKLWSKLFEIELVDAD